MPRLYRNLQPSCEWDYASYGYDVRRSVSSASNRRGIDVGSGIFYDERETII